jgi:hypothetical protein
LQPSILLYRGTPVNLAARRVGLSHRERVFVGGLRRRREKKPVALLERHRLEDGIPKEEEEKPRKEIIQQTMVQRNNIII